MIEILRNRPLIINADLDGIISGLLLSKYLNCSIVGFSNSNKEIWLRQDFNKELKSICFVDLFVVNPDIVSVDQHIIAGNETHFKELSKNPNKINPNLLNPRFHKPSKSYRLKYPFGTVHFIIALLERNGIDLSEIKLQKELQGIKFIDLLLRADDCMKTSIYSSYTSNAEEWWAWLYSYSKKGKTIAACKGYLDNFSKKEAEQIKRKLSRFMKNAPYNCDSSDGGIDQLTTNGFIKENVFQLVELLCNLTEEPVFKLGGLYKKFTGIAERTTLSDTQLTELTLKGTIDKKRVFSYAFVRTVEREEYFSVTFYQN